MIEQQEFEKSAISERCRSLDCTEFANLVQGICGGRRIRDLDFFVSAIHRRMYWCFPILSELQEEQFCL